MADHQEFKFEGFLQPDGTVKPTLTPDHAPTTKVHLGAPVNLAQPAIDAAKLAYEIGKTPQDGWAAAIQIAPVELQERLKTILRREWADRAARNERAANQRRRASGGHQSATGDAALAEMGKRLGVRK